MGSIQTQLQLEYGLHEITANVITDQGQGETTELVSIPVKHCYEYWKDADCLKNWTLLVRAGFQRNYFNTLGDRLRISFPASEQDTIGICQKQRTHGGPRISGLARIVPKLPVTGKYTIEFHDNSYGGASFDPSTKVIIEVRPSGLFYYNKSTKQFSPTLLYVDTYQLHLVIQSQGADVELDIFRFEEVGGVQPSLCLDVPDALTFPMNVGTRLLDAMIQNTDYIVAYTIDGTLPYAGYSTQYVTPGQDIVINSPCILRAIAYRKSASDASSNRYYGSNEVVANIVSETSALPAIFPRQSSRKDAWLHNRYVTPKTPNNSTTLVLVDGLDRTLADNEAVDLYSLTQNSDEDGVFVTLTIKSQQAGKSDTLVAQEYRLLETTPQATKQVLGSGDPLMPLPFASVDNNTPIPYNTPITFQGRCRVSESPHGFSTADDSEFAENVQVLLKRNTRFFVARKEVGQNMSNVVCMDYKVVQANNEDTETLLHDSSVVVKKATSDNPIVYDGNYRFAIGNNIPNQTPSYRHTAWANGSGVQLVHQSQSLFKTAFSTKNVESILELALPCANGSFATAALVKLIGVSGFELDGEFKFGTINVKFSQRVTSHGMIKDAANTIFRLNDLFVPAIETHELGLTVTVNGETRPSRYISPELMVRLARNNDQSRLVILDMFENKDLETHNDLKGRVVYDSGWVSTFADALTLKLTTVGKIANQQGAGTVVVKQITKPCSSLANKNSFLQYGYAEQPSSMQVTVVNSNPTSPHYAWNPASSVTFSIDRPSDVFYHVNIPRNHSFLYYRNAVNGSIILPQPAVGYLQHRFYDPNSAFHYFPFFGPMLSVNESFAFNDLVTIVGITSKTQSFKLRSHVGYLTNSKNYNNEKYVALVDNNLVSIRKMLLDLNLSPGQHTIAIGLLDKQEDALLELTNGNAQYGWFTNYCARTTPEYSFVVPESLDISGSIEYEMNTVENVIVQVNSSIAVNNTYRLMIFGQTLTHATASAQATFVVPIPLTYLSDSIEALCEVSNQAQKATLTLSLLRPQQTRQMPQQLRPPVTHRLG